MMKNLFLLFVFVCGTWGSGIAQEASLEELLAQAPDVSFEKIKSYDSTRSAYKLMIKQALDHSDPSKGYFFQKVYLSHKGFDRPAIMVTNGYQVDRPWREELTTMLDANQLIVEHRYFGRSMPDAVDYGYLNLEQATADLHHIREVFDAIYKQKWISTGVSKGGATTIFYKYFYPNDVDVSVPYVAPINRAQEEPRIYAFLDTIGSDECRKKIHDFQIRALDSRAEILPILQTFSEKQQLNYNLMSMEAAFEYAVMDYNFAFFQYGQTCENIPADTASAQAVADHLFGVSSPTYFSDEGIRRFASHYYQAATEMGYYGFETSKFKGHLNALPTDSNPMCLFYHFDMQDGFNGELLDKVNAWLESENANKLMYIYGANDTWTASAVPENDKVNSAWFFMEGKHHGNARIREMNEADKQRCYATLEKWLEMEIGSTTQN